jgi:hypothetical protein
VHRRRIILIAIILVFVVITINIIIVAVGGRCKQRAHKLHAPFFSLLLVTSVRIDVPLRSSCALLLALLISSTTAGLSSSRLVALVTVSALMLVAVSRIARDRRLCRRGASSVTISLCLRACTSFSSA